MKKNESGRNNSIKEIKKNESGRNNSIKEIKKNESGRNKPIKEIKKIESGRNNNSNTLNLCCVLFFLVLSAWEVIRV